MKNIAAFIVLLVLLTSCYVKKGPTQSDFIYSVNGKLKTNSLNQSLIHEHIMSNFGEDPRYVGAYDSIALFDQVIPYLNYIKSLGVHSIFECTTAYFGRNVQLLKTLADTTGIQIITNTGFYGAANDRYVPEIAYTLNKHDLAKIWISEFEDGVDKTSIKPGFIKLAFDEGEPSEIDIKLFEAGIETHLKTGLTLTVHTANNIKAAKLQLRLLRENKVSPNAWVWTHANKVEDKTYLVKAASQGAWISLDGVNDSNIADYVKTIELFKKKKLYTKILISHDGNSFPSGGPIRKFESISTSLVPRLINLGYSDKEIDQLLVGNPKEAFSTRIRRLE